MAEATHVHVSPRGHRQASLTRTLLLHPATRTSMLVITEDHPLNDALIACGIERLLRLVADLQAIRDGTCPTAADLSDAPILDHWAGDVRPARCLAGYATNHPLLPGAGRSIVTSDLWVLAEDQGWARTLSRWYCLGRSRAASVLPS
jgi:hypothetical protein